MAGHRGQLTSTSAKVTKSQGAPFRLVIPFEDNVALTRALGEYDSHLALLEDRLGIEAHPHGNVITLKGLESSCIQARAVLEEVYKRSLKGEIISTGDFEGLIRHVSQNDIQSPEGQAQIATRRRLVLARTPVQTLYIKALEKSDLVFGIGPAGTGKTYLAVAYAAHCLERGIVEKIILSRPAVEAGERLGFLPGDMREKVDPYLRPLYDALDDVLPPQKVEKDLETGVIEIAPLAFMRGRTLANAFIILDEAQNTTPMQMKMLLTRLGEKSKMVITGDPTQIDLPLGSKSGLEQAIGLLKGVPGIEVIHFSKIDVIRRDLVARIVEAYDNASGRSV